MQMRGSCSRVSICGACVPHEILKRTGVKQLPREGTPCGISPEAAVRPVVTQGVEGTHVPGIPMTAWHDEKHQARAANPGPVLLDVAPKGLPLGRVGAALASGPARGGKGRNCRTIAFRTMGQASLRLPEIAGGPGGASRAGCGGLGLRQVTCLRRPGNRAERANTMTRDFAVRREQEADPVFIGETPLLHPSWVAGRMTPLLHHSYNYGPAIHARSHIQNLACAEADQTLTVAATSAKHSTVWSSPRTGRTSPARTTRPYSRGRNVAKGRANCRGRTVR